MLIHSQSWWSCSQVQHLGERRGTTWTCQQPVTGLTHQLLLDMNFSSQTHSQQQENVWWIQGRANTCRRLSNLVFFLILRYLYYFSLFYLFCVHCMLQMSLTCPPIHTYGQFGLKEEEKPTQAQRLRTKLPFFSEVTVHAPCPIKYSAPNNLCQLMEASCTLCDF